MTEDIIEIEYRPVKKIVILSLIELTNEELFARTSAVLQAGQPMALYWAEGIVFMALPTNPAFTQVDEDFSKGITYYSAILYSLMPEYKSIHKVRTVDIPIIDQSKERISKAITQWIKKRMNEP